MFHDHLYHGSRNWHPSLPKSMPPKPFSTPILLVFKLFQAVLSGLQTDSLSFLFIPFLAVAVVCLVMDPNPVFLPGPGPTILVILKPATWVKVQSFHRHYPEFKSFVAPLLNSDRLVSFIDLPALLFMLFHLWIVYTSAPQSCSPKFYGVLLFNVAVSILDSTICHDANRWSSVCSPVSIGGSWIIGLIVFEMSCK